MDNINNNKNKTSDPPIEIPSPNDGSIDINKINNNIINNKNKNNNKNDQENENENKNNNESEQKCNPFITKEIIEMNSIRCEKEHSCDGLIVSINNRGCDELIINELDCMATDSCTNGIFNVIGDVKINKCDCGSSCTAIGLEDYCFSVLPMMECGDAFGYQSQIQTIINPMNNFNFLCSNTNSCGPARFSIQTNNGQIRQLGAFLFGGLDASGIFCYMETTQLTNCAFIRIGNNTITKYSMKYSLPSMKYYCIFIIINVLMVAMTFVCIDYI